MNSIILALVSGGLFGFVAFWVSAWIGMKIEDHWPGNYCTGEGIPPGCSFFFVVVLTLAAAISGALLSWGAV